MQNNPVLTVIVPVYNEVKTIEKIMEKIVSAEPADKEIIVVDDYSTDGTEDALKRLKNQFEFILISNTENLGKGAALRKALTVAKGKIIVPQDADLEVDPEDYLKLMEPILKDEADVVFGTRLKYIRRQDYILRTLLVNKLFVFAINLLYRSHYTDIMTCYKMCKTEVLRNLNLEASRFDIEPEIACKAAKRKYRVAEVPISYFPRTWREGKKIKWTDTFSILKTIVRIYFRH